MKTRMRMHRAYKHEWKNDILSVYPNAPKVITEEYLDPFLLDWCLMYGVDTEIPYKASKIGDNKLVDWLWRFLENDHEYLTYTKIERTLKLNGRALARLKELQDEKVK